MATNSFTEFNLPEAQQLGDYTSIEVDLRSAFGFATTMPAEMRRPLPNYSFADPFMVATIIRYARAFSQGVRLKLYDAGRIYSNR
jgi:hypothetical protein